MCWEADLYLCTVPPVAEPELESDPAIHPLCGVRWGFQILKDGAPGCRSREGVRVMPGERTQEY